jgi:hypothetical protein
MYIRKIIFLTFIVFTLSNFINANENYTNSINFKFSEKTILAKNYTPANGSLLSEKIQLYALSGNANAQKFFYLGIAGAIVHAVGLCMIIPSAVLLALDYAGRIVYTDLAHRTALLISCGILLGFGALFAVSGLIMAGVGFGLFFYYGGKLAYMYNETDYKKGVLISGFAVRLK